MVERMGNILGGLIRSGGVVVRIGGAMERKQL